MPNASAYRYDAPLDFYQSQAEDLLVATKSGSMEARLRFKWEHPRFNGVPVDEVHIEPLGLADAQLVVAHQYGFERWDDLAAYTEAVKRDPCVSRVEAAVEAVVSGDLETLNAMLRDHPELACARSTRRHHATLLHYIAANGVEGVRQKTPPNAVDVAKALLEAGAEVDALADMYNEKCTTMSMLVSSAHPAQAGLQADLAETLLDYGAALAGPGTNWQSALMTALAFGYQKTAEALAKRGAPLDHLAAAAGLGRVDDTVRLLQTADPHSKHVAVALAAQHGHVATLRLLLDSGEDPNRYNPDGYHAHSTPLHQAVWSNHMDVVRLLVAHGARLDIRDTVYGGAPLDWAIHGGRNEIAQYLREQQAQAAT